jgi:GNAT superfamily N-acetyltransferase
VIIAEGRLSVKWYEPVHIDQLRDLHRCCFPAEQWKRGDFQKFVDNRSGRNNVVKVLVDERETVYGSMLYTLDAASCRFRRVAVWPDYRRRGLGAFMLNSLCGPTSPFQRKLFLARVREDNAVAQLFFRDGMGFQFDPERPREKAEGTELDYYEFTFVKPGAKVVVVDDE